MAKKPITVSWVNVKEAREANAARILQGSSVLVESKHHEEKPWGYRISSKLPEILHRWGGVKEVVAYDPLDAEPVQEGSSVYRSAVIEIPAPARQDRETRVLAECIDHQGQIVAGLPAYVLSTLFYLSERVIKSNATISVNPGAVLPVPVQAVLGTFEWGRKALVKYQGRTVVDPRIEVSLLSGQELEEYLLDVARTYHPETAPSIGEVLGSDAAVRYFRDERYASRVIVETLDLEPGSEVPFEIGVHLDDADDAQVAFAVVLRDLEAGTSFITDPVFVTGVGTRAIATDIPVSALSEEADRALLEYGGGDADAAWDAVVDAADELGVDDVADAVAFYRFMRGEPLRFARG